MFVGCIWWMRIWYQPVHPVNLEWSVHTDRKRMWKRLIPLKGPTFPVVDPGFPRSGGANPPGGANLRFYQIFLKTGRNWKNLDGGGECALAPLRSDNSLRNRWWIQDFPEKVGCGANLWFCIKNLLFGNILAEKPHDNEKKWGGGGVASLMLLLQWFLVLPIFSEKREKISRFSFVEPPTSGKENLQISS